MTRPIRASFSTTESAYLLLDRDLWTKSGCGMLGWCTFMKLKLMKKGLPALAARSRYSREAFSTYSSKKGIPTMPCAGVLTYCPLILNTSRAGWPAFPSRAPLRPGGGRHEPNREQDERNQPDRSRVTHVCVPPWSVRYLHYAAARRAGATRSSARRGVDRSGPAIV